MVEIAKSDGSKRLLGIPTVADRIAQAVVKDQLEQLVEPKFHEDSYGYCPKTSALDAVGVARARQRCWQQDWCIDLNIKNFFDSLDHQLMMKAIRFHSEEKWIHLYVERWLKVRLQLESGELVERQSCTPQGGVASPLLANIFMHHAFDDWMRRHYPEVRFEHFADDILAHCSSQKQAKKVLEEIKIRLKECSLELHPEKTKIVYFKDDYRGGSYEYESFDFFGYTFRPRLSMNKYGKTFVNFTPAISKQAANRIRKEIRSWRIHLRSDKTITDLARMFNAYVQGWVNYYGRYYKSAMYPFLPNMEHFLTRWVMRKYKRFQGYKKRARNWFGCVRKRQPRLFVHWKLGLGSRFG
ncbi:group II intron reverse transcriptase/maturase [Rickettsia tamurae]|uniref:group II intron reverse transcriptase/maturase n=1 Tax=Rickettsia tamurae TaxID=334545 RepID=UPI001F3DB4BF|nr:group II intron reverse transcriptase/maturase [Rickettsia tamurae]